MSFIIDDIDVAIFELYYSDVKNIEMLKASEFEKYYYWLKKEAFFPTLGALHKYIFKVFVEAPLRIFDDYTFKEKYEYEGYYFYPIAFLYDLYVSGLDIKMLYDKCYLMSMVSGFKSYTCPETNLLYGSQAYFLSHDECFTVDFEKQPYSSPSFIYERNIYNRLVNINFHIPYIEKEKIDSNDKISVTHKFLDNVDRIQRLFNQIKIKKNVSVNVCPHSLNDVVLTKVLVEVEDVCDEREYDPIREEDNMLNGTKNAIAVLHFFDFYREKWDLIENIYVIGIGVSKHLVSLIDMFPSKQIYYCDSVISNFLIKVKKENVHYINANIDKDYDFLPYSVVISDIRTESTDIGVHADNLLQFQWSRHKNILFGTYKFRYPFEVQVNYDINYDCLLLQPFRRSNSAETRLYISIFEDKFKKKLMDQDTYDFKNAFFNQEYRFESKKCNDCQLRDIVISNYRILPFYWARMFHKYTYDELESLSEVPDCKNNKACAIDNDKIYFSQCLFCLWIKSLKDRSYGD